MRRSGSWNVQLRSRRLVIMMMVTMMIFPPTMIPFTGALMMAPFSLPLPIPFPLPFPALPLLAFPVAMASPLFMTPPAALLPLIAIVPPASVAPASAIPVLTMTIAVAQMQRHAWGQSNSGAVGQCCVCSKRG